MPYGVRGGRGQHSYKDSQERETYLPHIEAVDITEDQAEGAKEKIKDA